MKLSYDGAWADLVGMWRASHSVLLIVAGAFLFLPDFLVGLVAPFPESDATTLREILQVMVAYIRGNAPLLLAVQLIGLFGSIVIYVLLLDRRRPTVADALRYAAALFLPVFVAVWLGNLASLLLLFSLILPALYLSARLAVTQPLMAERDLRNPLDGLTASFAMTRGNGWRIVGLLLIVLIVAQIALSAVTFVVGGIFAFFASSEISIAISALLDAAASMIIGLLLLLVSAAIYRQLSATPQPAAGS